MKFEFEVESKGQISDGYHTFDELYNHRMIFFNIYVTHIKIKPGSNGFMIKVQCLKITF